ncbi:MAG: diacylglycerol kinase family protein [Deltaproteobacteria bacterium]|nr:diacylglycerol kinase family protein [Deltaproteobacteria bacterium]
MTLESPLRRRLASFGYAARGIATMLRSEPNARIHAVATLVVVAAGFAFGIERSEWLAVVLAIGGVWAAEGFNTAFEALCDVASPGRHPLVARAKDVAAGAVLLAACTALGVALLVFGPRIAALLPA